MFCETVNGSKQLTILAKRSILDVWHGSECVSSVVANSPIRIHKLVDFVKYSAGCLICAEYNLFTFLSISLFKLYLMFCYFPFYHHILHAIVWNRKVIQRSKKVMNCYTRRTKLEDLLCLYYNPVDIGRKLNVHKTFRRRPGCLLNVVCTFNLRPVSTGKVPFFKSNENIKKALA